MTLDSEAVIENYGEAIDYYIYDRQDMDTFMRLAQLNDGNMGDIVKIVSDMVRDEDGNLILDGQNMLPMDVTLQVVEQVVNKLGNLKSQTSEKSQA